MIEIRLTRTGIINIPAMNMSAVLLSVARKIPNIDRGGITWKSQCFHPGVLLLLSGDFTSVHPLNLCSWRLLNIDLIRERSRTGRSMISISPRTPRVFPTGTLVLPCTSGILLVVVDSSHSEVIQKGQCRLKGGGSIRYFLYLTPSGPSSLYSGVQFLLLQNCRTALRGFSSTTQPQIKKPPQGWFFYLVEAATAEQRV